MIATITADADNLQESLSTLKYANRMKDLQTEPIVNEESASKIIKELEEEITRLKVVF
jgi:hypothetical protein